MHSLAFRAMGMADQLHRLERKLAGRDVAELLAIPALDGLRPSFWGYCVIATVRGFTHDGTARGIGPEHLPPLPRGADRAGPVLAWARQLWALLRDPAGAVPLEHDAYLKMWQLEGARLPDWAEVLYVDEAQDADPVTLAILQAQRRPTVWVGDPWQSIYRFRGSVNAMRTIDAPQRPLTRSWRFGEELARMARGILAHTSAPPALALHGAPGLATVLGPVRPPCTVLCRTNAGLFEAAVHGRDRVHLVGGVEPLARLVLGGWRLRQGEPVPEVPSLARFRGWDERLRQGSCQRLWPARAWPGYTAAPRRGGGEMRCIGMRIGGRDGAARAHRPGLPPVPLPHVRQAVQRALRHPAEPGPVPLRRHRARGALAPALQADPAGPARDVRRSRHRVQPRGRPGVGGQARAALAEELRRRRRGKAGRSWYVDETYLKVGGRWCYLYRAIDRTGAWSTCCSASTATWRRPTPSSARPRR